MPRSISQSHTTHLTDNKDFVFLSLACSSCSVVSIIGLWGVLYHHHYDYHYHFGRPVMQCLEQLPAWTLPFVVLLRPSERASPLSARPPCSHRTRPVTNLPVSFCLRASLQGKVFARRTAAIARPQEGTVCISDLRNLPSKHIGVSAAAASCGAASPINHSREQNKSARFGDPGVLGPG